MAINSATRKQNQEIVSELTKLKEQMKDLISEIKFDLDNPKPTELPTEANSKQILELSEKVFPTVKKCDIALEKVDKILTRVDNYLRN